jgi:hypothetical protein
MGWVPKEDFRGDEERWVEAETFLERGENIMPILKERLSKFEKENKETAAKLEKATKDLETFVAHHKQTYKRAYDNAFRDLKDKQREAVTAGDTDAYDKLQQEYEDLQKEVDDLREQQAPTESPESPVFREWLAENPWYQTDTDIRYYVDALGANLQANQVYQTDQEFYAELTRKAKEAFPHKFAPKQQAAVAAVEGDGGADADLTATGKKWGDVPPEAKQTYLELFSDIPNFDKEDYAKDYWAQFEEAG